MEYQKFSDVEVEKLSKQSWSIQEIFSSIDLCAVPEFHEDYLINFNDSAAKNILKEIKC